MNPDLIPATSIGMSIANIQQSFDTSLLKNTLDMAQEESNELLQSIDPYRGHQLDIRV